MKFIKLIHILNRLLNTKLCFYEPVFQALKFWDDSSDFGYWSVRESFDFFEKKFRAMKNQNISRCVIDESVRIKFELLKQAIRAIELWGFPRYFRRNWLAKFELFEQATWAMETRTISSYFIVRFGLRKIFVSKAN